MKKIVTIVFSFCLLVSVDLEPMLRRSHQMLSRGATGSYTNMLRNTARQMYTRSGDVDVIGGMIGASGFVAGCGILWKASQSQDKEAVKQYDLAEFVQEKVHKDLKEDGLRRAFWEQRSLVDGIDAYWLDSHWNDKKEEFDGFLRDYVDAGLAQIVQFELDEETFVYVVVFESQLRENKDICMLDHRSYCFGGTQSLDFHCLKGQWERLKEKRYHSDSMWLIYHKATADESDAVVDENIRRVVEYTEWVEKNAHKYRRRVDPYPMVSTWNIDEFEYLHGPVDKVNERIRQRESKRVDVDA